MVCSLVSSSMRTDFVMRRVVGSPKPEIVFLDGRFANADVKGRVSRFRFQSSKCFPMRSSALTPV